MLQDLNSHSEEINFRYGGQRGAEDMPRGREEDATPTNYEYNTAVIGNRRSAKTYHGQTS